MSILNRRAPWAVAIAAGALLVAMPAADASRANCHTFGGGTAAAEWSAGTDYKVHYFPDAGVKLVASKTKVVVKEKGSTVVHVQLFSVDKTGTATVYERTDGPGTFKPAKGMKFDDVLVCVADPTATSDTGEGVRWF